jgi:hypothetical protein
MLAGVIGIFGGYLAARHAEHISILFDRRRRKIFLVGTLPWRRRRAAWRFDDVATVEPEQRLDSEGDPMWRPVLVLKSGERIPMMANWRNDRDSIVAICRQACLQLQTPD